MRGVLPLLLVAAVVMVYLGGSGIPGLGRLDVPPVWEGGEPPPAGMPGGVPVLCAAAAPPSFGLLPAPEAALAEVRGEPEGGGGPSGEGAVSGGRGDVEYVRGGAGR